MVPFLMELVALPGMPNSTSCGVSPLDSSDLRAGSVLTHPHVPSFPSSRAIHRENANLTICWRSKRSKTQGTICATTGEQIYGAMGTL